MALIVFLLSRRSDFVDVESARPVMARDDFRKTDGSAGVQHQGGRITFRSFHSKQCRRGRDDRVARDFFSFTGRNDAAPRKEKFCRLKCSATETSWQGVTVDRLFGAPFAARTPLRYVTANDTSTG